MRRRVSHWQVGYWLQVVSPMRGDACQGGTQIVDYCTHAQEQLHAHHGHERPQGYQQQGRATQMNDHEETAKRMLSMYKHSTYTPYARATDHAFAYDSHESGRKFWLAVLQDMYRLENQYRPLTEKT